jgi:hypothetical protein
MSVVAPTHNCPVVQQGQTVPTAGCNGHHPTESRRRGGLPVVVVSPTNHGPIAQQGKTVPVTRGNRHHLAQSLGWAGLSIRIITPAHDRSVTSQGKTVVPPRGYSDHVGQAHGSIRLTVPVVAPSRDRTVVGWGNDDDRVSPPAGLTDVVAIAAGDARSLALATVRPKLAALGFLSGGEFKFTPWGRRRSLRD